MEQREFLRKQLLKKTKEQINEKFAGREIHIIKAVNLLSDLDSINNLMKENTAEWKMRQPTGDAQVAFSELEKNTQGIEEEKKQLTEFIEKEMTAEFPNFSILATPVLGAKLLASAGSKKSLCFMPASTIQVLGAEKALFAHMRNHAKSPKHGHLFNHPLMQKLPRFKRGKVARIISGKLAIALKQDYFEGENTANEVLKELEERVAGIANEPVTTKQKQREEMLIKAHEEQPAKKAESKTFTPEERRAYFDSKNKDSPRPERAFAPRTPARDAPRSSSYGAYPRPRYNTDFRRNDRAPARRAFSPNRGQQYEPIHRNRKGSEGITDSPYHKPRFNNNFRSESRPLADRSFGSRESRSDGQSYRAREVKEEGAGGHGRGSRSFGKGRFGKPHARKRY